MTRLPERAELEKLRAAALEIAQRGSGDSARLLNLLRTLERAHREIREGLFQESLPISRRELYRFLKEIEENGGWPYIPRMSLGQVLARLLEAEAAEDPRDAAKYDDPPPPGGLS